MTGALVLVRLPQPELPLRQTPLRGFQVSLRLLQKPPFVPAAPAAAYVGQSVHRATLQPPSATESAGQRQKTPQTPPTAGVAPALLKSTGSINMSLTCFRTWRNRSRADSASLRPEGSSGPAEPGPCEGGRNRTAAEAAPVGTPDPPGYRSLWPLQTSGRHYRPRPPTPR